MHVHGNTAISCLDYSRNMRVHIHVAYHHINFIAKLMV